MRKYSSIRTPLLTCTAVLIAMGAMASVSYAKSFARPWVPSTAAQPNPTVLVPVNDTCAGAIEIQCGTFNLFGDTSTANNDYTFPVDSVSCTGVVANGRDVVYRINAVAGDSLWVDMSSTAFDASIYIITDCADPTASCVAGEDSTDIGFAETLRYTFTQTGTYYLVLDSFNAGSGGAWTANGQLICINAPPAPPNDNCTTPIAIACGPFSFNGSTEFATNDYQFPDVGSSCFGSRAEGKDVTFRLIVEAGDSLWVNYTTSTDGAIYLVSDCGDLVNSCIMGRDVTGTNQTEQVRYRFTFAGTYFLILDSKAADSFGAWTAVGEYVCPQPPKNDHHFYTQPIPCGDFNLEGSTMLAHDDYYFNSDLESCTGYRASGRDVIYHVYATVGDSIWIDYRSTADASIYIATNPGDVIGTCVVGEDSTTFGETETLRYKFPATGTYYIILDSFGVNTGGQWTMVGRMNCPNLAVGGDGPVTRLALGLPMPNPFRSTTMIPFALPRKGNVALRLLDLQGRVVRTLEDGEFPAGAHQSRWDGRDDHGQVVHAGVYFVKITTGDGNAMRRAVFVR